MKTTLPNITMINLLLIFVLSVSESRSQNLYTLDLSASSNFSASCGTITPGQWSVKNNYCSLITAPVTYPGNPSIDPPMIAPVTVIFGNTGNIDCGEIYPDGAFVRTSVNNGPWYTQASVSPCKFNNSGAFSASFKLFAPAGANVRIMVNIAVTSSNDKIWVKNGDITIGTPVIANESSWTKRVASPGINNNNAPAAEESTPVFSIYPNPSDGNNITLSLNNSKSDEILVALYDVMGREVYSKLVITSNGGFLHAIDNSSDLQPGVYLIVGTNKNEIYKEKLIIKK